MPLEEKSPGKITERDLLGLFGSEPEGKTIDYKRDPVGPADTDRKEFL